MKNTSLKILSPLSSGLKTPLVAMTVLEKKVVVNLSYPTSIFVDR
jgi:hypothetical protein